MPPTPEPIEPRLSVTTFAQFVRLDNCQRYLRFRLRPDETHAFLDRWNITEQPLAALLHETGTRIEAEVVAQLDKYGLPVVSLDTGTVEDTFFHLQNVKRPLFLLQVPLASALGGYLVNGRADVVRLERTRQGVSVYIADIKASRREKMEHRLQVALYARLLRQEAERAGLKIANISGAVLCLKEDGTLPDLDVSAGFDLTEFDSVIDQVVAGPQSIVREIETLPFADVPYHLAYKCDGCMYNAICMYDSAERRDLSLVPHITPTEKRILQEQGFTTLDALARLMRMPNRAEGERDYQAAAGQEAQVTRLTREWSIGTNLSLLVQRARRALRRFDRTVESTTYLLNSGQSTLPEESTHPGLIKIFIDAQNDYLQDRLYLLSGRVVGPTGSRTIVEMTEGPPTTDAERELLVLWVARIMDAVLACTTAPEAPVHLYCYHRYDQSVLLTALKRHLSEVASLPAFYDLLTQHPALSQPIISFIADELKDRYALGMVCQSLHDSARQTRFDWQDEGYPYFELFRAGMFDNRRTMTYDPGGRLTAAPVGTPEAFPIEAASRFNSQIPLEYAYATWEQLPEVGDARRLAPFRRITRDVLLRFAAKRVEALAHLEQWIRYKSTRMNKPPLRLPSITGSSLVPDLAQSLIEFLYMEHHAGLQSKLQHYLLPIPQRVMTGNTVLLVYERQIEKDVHMFRLAYEEVGLDPELAFPNLRLREGAWTVLNDADRPYGHHYGRLAIVQAVTATSLTLKTLGLSFKNSYFRYGHFVSLPLEPESYYTLDEMADDLNADKALEALANVDSNTLYQWLTTPPSVRVLPPDVLDVAGRVLTTINTVEGAKRLTARQAEIVAERIGDPLLLVQGPPGTGKSQTIGWAILTRMAVAAAQGQALRVAVCCKSHNAVNIVLEAVAAKVQRLTVFPTALTQPLLSLGIYKIGSRDDAAASDEGTGVNVLDSYTAGPARFEALLAQPLVLVGGTPGGFYSLAKYRGAGGRSKVSWDNAPFDLLVMDEASQMSLPEAILAGAFVAPTGQVLVVGDHRQMPPIVSHGWQEEARRSALERQPFKSLFETLLDRPIPRVALDQSFRLHERTAAFLQQQVYRRDGILFYSKRRERIAMPPPGDPFINVVLDPDFPIVVIDHDESRSRQYNRLEAELVAPLIEVCANNLRLDGADGIGVVVPHRAQKALLRARFPELATVESIDTVERFQGGERDVIIVSATASDPDFVLAEADFLLNLNRLNVALSRPRKKLIVVAAKSVINLLLSDLATWDNAVIWKQLYYNYTNVPLWQGKVGDVNVNVRGRAA